MNWNYNKVESIKNVRANNTDPVLVLKRPTLTYGDQGEYVVLLQNELRNLNYYNGVVNGNFDDLTLESVREFQVVNKLNSDGVVDHNTWSALIYLYSPLDICGGNYYIVQINDTLWSIARKFDTTVAELKSLNNLTSDLLKVGQRLLVTKTPTPTQPQTNIYIVVKGDTLWSIANKLNTTVDQIKTLNNLTSNIINIGEQINIPSKSSTQTYTVIKNDTLWSIANRFNTTVDKIKNLNNLTSNILNIGQVLKIPS